MKETAVGLDISLHRCYYHESREAVACCPECNRFFCRECVTEHEDRVLCADCLKLLQLEATVSGQDRGFHFYRAVEAALFLMGFLVIWLFFYFTGRALILTPSEFHHESLWKSEKQDR